MDSQASLLWAQVMHLAPTLRCPTRRDPTLRALTSMDLDSKALPATLWVSYDDRVASYTKGLQQSLAIRVDRHEHKTSAAFPLRKFLVNTGGRNFTGTSHLALLVVMSPRQCRTSRRRHEFPFTCNCHMTVLTMTSSRRAANRKKTQWQWGRRWTWKELSCWNILREYDFLHLCAVCSSAYMTFFPPDLSL